VARIDRRKIGCLCQLPRFGRERPTGDPIRALRQTQIDFARGPDPESTLRIWALYVVMISPGLSLPE
jgi:hypothetical protein